MFALVAIFCFAVIALYVTTVKWLVRIAVFVVGAVWELAHGRTPRII